jgi:Uma2 family endonuclease
MTEMPLLIVEVLSPTQGVQEIFDTYQVYFAVGVQSCWLVYPAAVTVVVYASPDDFTSFSSGDVVDTTLDIRLPLREMFA